MDLPLKGLNGGFIAVHHIGNGRAQICGHRLVELHALGNGRCNLLTQLCFKLRPAGLAGFQGARLYIKKGKRIGHIGINKRRHIAGSGERVGFEIAQIIAGDHAAFKKVGQVFRYCARDRAIAGAFCKQGGAKRNIAGLLIGQIVRPAQKIFHTRRQAITCQGRHRGNPGQKEGHIVDRAHMKRDRLGRIGEHHAGFGAKDQPVDEHQQHQIL